MKNAIILIDNQLDPLWLHHLPPADSLTVINLQNPSSHINVPYYHNYPGWRRWLKNHRVTHLYLYTSLSRSHIILTAAASLPVTTIFLLTGPAHVRSLSKPIAITRYLDTISCPSHSLARLLRQTNIPSRKIIVEIPSVKTPLFANKPSVPLSARQGPVILALPQPSEKSALRLATWTAALLHHVNPRLTLLISGSAAFTDRVRLRDWQFNWDSPNMIHLAPTDTHWPDLLPACDLVLAAATQPTDVIRLLYARAAHTPIVAPQGPYDEFLREYEAATLVTPSEPRRFAAAILSRTKTDHPNSTAYG